VCGLTTEASIVCWGANEGGQLGDDTFDSRNTPAPIKGG
jgi:alpha-tubulin suppressor-like RCC1 family protein